jgi:hypothetical protein
MNSNMDLVGKTISGVVASPSNGPGPVRIYLLQFSDGSHVEFVSPSARRRLRTVSGTRSRRSEQTPADPQLALNVA